MRQSWVIPHFTAVVALVVWLIVIVLLFVLEMVIALVFTFKILTLLGACCLFVLLCNKLLPHVRVTELPHRGTQLHHNEGNKTLFWIIMGKSTLL